jgi:hypothetical protein
MNVLLLFLWSCTAAPTPDYARGSGPMSVGTQIESSTPVDSGSANDSGDGGNSDTGDSNDTGATKH